MAAYVGIEVAKLQSAKTEGVVGCAYVYKVVLFITICCLRLQLELTTSVHWPVR